MLAMKSAWPGKKRFLGQYPLHRKWGAKPGEFKHQLQHWVNEQYRIDAVKASYARYNRQAAICIQSVFLVVC